MKGMKHPAVFFISISAIGIFIACGAHAQPLERYLEDKALTAARISVQVPGAPAQDIWWKKIWSYVGIRTPIRIRPKEGTVLTVNSSAYASSPYQTDATPCITASGTTVRPGVVATNFLPLGTVVSINNENYIVEDRMNTRYNGYYMDIWFPSTSEALEFGRKKLDITIVTYKEPGDEVRPTPTPIPEVVEEDPSLWQSLSSTLTTLTGFLATKTYSNPDAHDVDCSK